MGRQHPRPSRRPRRRQRPDRTHAVPPRTERLPAHRPRQVHEHEFLPRVRKAGSSGREPSYHFPLRRHESGGGGGGVHRFVEEGRGMAWVGAGTDDVFVRQLRQAVRLRGDPDQEGPGVRVRHDEGRDGGAEGPGEAKGRGEERRAGSGFRGADTESRRSAGTQPRHVRGAQSEAVRGDATGPARRREIDAAAQDGLREFQPEHVRPGRVSDQVHAPPARGGGVVRVPRV
mmetsp:Transcript_100/g.245  ORF Transcript_100/g.245 Transcript_100/m.245 type:complete len:230 (-) Transcript_100:1353-2042(-)